MSRLDDTRRKKYYTQTLLYLFFFVLLVIFFLTIGIKIIINTSLYVSQLNKPVDNEKLNNLEMPPDITNIPDATNSAQLIISGQATANRNLSVFVNDDVQKQLVTDENGFTSDITLQIGGNSVYVEITDPSTNQIKKSPVYTVVYQNKKPKLDISSPTDQSTVNKDSIDVNGVTDSGMTIKINGTPVVVGADYSFSQNIQLNEGSNTINIVATDNAGNSEIKDLTVTYQKD